MKGQWFGELTGTNSGTINLDVDERRLHFESVAYVAMNEEQSPDLFLAINTPDKSTQFSIRIGGIGFAHDGVILSKENALQHYPNVTLPDFIDTTWKIGAREMSVDWQTNIGTQGIATLKLNDGDKPSKKIADQVTSWSGFKEYVLSQSGDSMIFRGQEDRNWRLRTSFHREGRANVYRFANDDVPILYKNLSNLTEHLFDLEKPFEYGAFVSMVQHHGYPTPLLDWTYSPFVAAFFAFNDTDKASESSDRFVRVHAFDKGQWMADFPQFGSLKVHKPHFSVLETLALNNPRMIPQQALATVTNVADIETYIQQCEAKAEKTYLRVFDIPMAERNIVLKELRMMGITAGSLFPGIEGACRQIRAQMFEYY